VDTVGGGGTIKGNTLSSWVQVGEKTGLWSEKSGGLEKKGRLKKGTCRRGNFWKFRKRGLVHRQLAEKGREVGDWSNGPTRVKATNAINQGY